jgi:hypothetical protein
VNLANGQPEPDIERLLRQVWSIWVAQCVRAMYYVSAVYCLNRGQQVDDRCDRPKWTAVDHGSEIVWWVLNWLIPSWVARFALFTILWRYVFFSDQIRIRVSHFLRLVSKISHEYHSYFVISIFSFNPTSFHFT